MYLYKKVVYGMSLFLILSMITGCDGIKQEDVSQKQQNTEKNIQTSNKPEQLEDITFQSGDIDSYMQYIKSVPDFEPYYRIVFAFEKLPNGISSLPFENVKSMYQEIRTSFDYVLVGEQPLCYVGNYTGDTKFVDGYEEYLHADAKEKTQNPINISGHDWFGKEIIVTPMKTVMLGEDVCKRFDVNIEQGRNLDSIDFVLKSPDDSIPVVLGYEYMETYELGDTFSLELISKVMNFEVVGFYKKDTKFSMDIGALHEVDLNQAIVIPHLMFGYEPTDEQELYQHAFIAGEKLSGFMAITDPVEKIDDHTYQKYEKTLDEIAKRNQVDGLYTFPYWPLGFVW